MRYIRRGYTVVVCSVALIFSFVFGVIPALAQAGRSADQSSAYKPLDVSRYPAEIQQDYKVFSTSCSKCHTLVRGLRETKTPAKATFWVHKMQAMPAAHISDRQAGEIIRFINYYQTHPVATKTEENASGNAAPPADPAAIRAGKEYFKTAMCTMCHTTSTSNDPQLVSLANVGRDLTKAQILDTLHGAKTKQGMPALPASTSPADLDHLVAFLQSLKGQ